MIGFAGKRSAIAAKQIASHGDAMLAEIPALVHRRLPGGGQNVPVSSGLVAQTLRSLGASAAGNAAVPSGLVAQAVRLLGAGAAGNAAVRSGLVAHPHRLGVGASGPASLANSSPLGARELTTQAGPVVSDEPANDESSRDKPASAVVPWNPFRQVQVATHSVLYPDTEFDIDMINQTEGAAVEQLLRTARSSDDVLKIFVAGEDTHAGLGTQEDFIQKLNFWKNLVKQARLSLIAQTSANYYCVGPNRYINAAIVADFTRGVTHCLVKRSTATIDRFASAPEMMLKGGPRVVGHGQMDLGFAICLDSDYLAGALHDSEALYKLALISSFGDPSSVSGFPQRTLRVIQDHQSFLSSGKSGGRAVRSGRPTRGVLDALYHVLLEKGDGATQDIPLSRSIDARPKSTANDVIEVDPAGRARRTTEVVPHGGAGDLISRLDVSDPVSLEMFATHSGRDPK